MKNKIIYLLVCTTLIASCGKKNDLEAKKERLAEYRSEAKELKAKISDLQSEIAEIDTTVENQVRRNAVIVNMKPAEVRDFSHKIEVRGQVESRKNVMLSSEIGGKIQSIHVSEGQKVKKGQALVTLDADILRNNIAELKTSLELADAVFKRQANLWEKNIGTEIQYLEAKNKKESLERRLSTAYAQLGQAIIKAPFKGNVDAIPVREGELAQPGLPLIRLVNPAAMYIQAAVSERYSGDFKKGDTVELYFPTQVKNITSVISSVSMVINPDNRTFSVDVQLPQLDFTAKPNQVVILKMEDYKVKDAVVVPTDVILSDKNGRYLYTASEENGATVARKKRVETGKAQDGQTEILSGIKTDDVIITAGYRGLSDGVHIKPVERTTETAQLYNH
ncbi:MAG: efflux RND transporter periplasmic adaptor subunit [Fulvivirga sp.]